MQRAAAAQRTALITGAGRGIGLATARVFQAGGWRVLSLDKQFGSEIVGERVDFDLRNLDKIPDFLPTLGAIDTLVNNAGVLFCDPLDAIPEDHRREILCVNLEAPAALIAAIAPQMRKRKSGRVVNVASVSAFTGHPDLWYGITKAGLLNLTKSWAKNLGPFGVHVNAVAPGPTETDMYKQLPQSRKDDFMRMVFSGRVCQPQEVAQTVFWLGASSPEYLSGGTVDMNNGFHMR